MEFPFFKEIAQEIIAQIEKNDVIKSIDIISQITGDETKGKEETKEKKEETKERKKNQRKKPTWKLIIKAKKEKVKTKKKRKRKSQSVLQVTL